MTLPRKPGRSQPIPNDPFDSPEVTTIKGPYWDVPLGSGLESDPYGSVQITGSDPSEPTAMLYGPNGFVGVGAGLQIGTEGELEQSGESYIYCTPQFGNLPVSYPPYGCETEVNTAGVTDFTEAWYDCEAITEFPCVDSSSVTDFSYAWEYCYALTSFPTINTSAGENFTYSWAYSGLTSFPKLNTSNGSIFYGAWCGCYDLSYFPKLDLSKGEDFTYAWIGCSSLTSFLSVDLSSGVTFGETWRGCSGLTSFPTLDVSSGENFYYSWFGCSQLTSFPPLNLGRGIAFSSAWQDCTNLTFFPPSMFDNCLATDFASAWVNCSLSQQSVNSILISINNAGQSNGILSIDGGTSASPGAAGLAAKVALESRGWTVTTN